MRVRCLRDVRRGEPMRFTPIDERTQRSYRFERNVAFGGVLEGVGLNQQDACLKNGLPHAVSMLTVTLRGTVRLAA